MDDSTSSTLSVHNILAFDGTFTWNSRFFCPVVPIFLVFIEMCLRKICMWDNECVRSKAAMNQRERWKRRIRRKLNKYEQNSRRNYIHIAAVQSVFVTASLPFKNVRPWWDLDLFGSVIPTPNAQQTYRSPAVIRKQKQFIPASDMILTPLTRIARLAAGKGGYCRQGFRLLRVLTSSQVVKKKSLLV